MTMLAGWGKAGGICMYFLRFMGRHLRDRRPSRRWRSQPPSPLLYRRRGFDCRVRTRGRRRVLHQNLGPENTISLVDQT